MTKKKRQPKNYTYHLVRGLVALVGASILSWAVWKLLEKFIVVAIVVLTIDHFHLKGARVNLISTSFVA